MSDYPKTLEQLREEQNRIRNRHESNATVTELPEAYARRLDDAGGIAAIIRQAEKITLRPQKQNLQAMDYEDARLVAWTIMKNLLAGRGKSPEVDDNNKSIIVNLIKYFINDPSGPYDPQKGIYLFGEVGSGKTFLMQTMQALTVAARIESRHFRIASTIEMAEQIRRLYSTNTKADPLERYAGGHWCFDDLGQEPASVLVYGDNRPIMEPVISRRYTTATLGHCTTHATSNLTPEKLEEHYGTRLADRFREMFNFVFLDGKSRR